MKRLITGNTGPNGELDKDKFAIAVLQYRNTPDPETGLSPAQMLFGHPIRDFIPILPYKYRPHTTWQVTPTFARYDRTRLYPKAAQKLPMSLRAYHKLRKDLIAVDGVILYKERVVIPKKLHNEVILTLHSAHQGVQGMLSRVKSSVFWPSITAEINGARSKCN